MKKRRKTARRRVTKRRVTKNPTIRRSYRAASPRRRRSVRRNPSGSGFARGILGELASKDGMMLLGAAALAPTAVNFVADRVVPTQYRTGWTGLIAKAAITAAAVFVLDKYAKQRKAALGFAVGSGASLLAEAVKLYQVKQVIPPAQGEMADVIAQNPVLFNEVMGGNFSSLNEYGMAPAPMSGYGLAPVADEFESLN